jgi:hypothetical protein
MSVKGQLSQKNGVALTIHQLTLTGPQGRSASNKLGWFAVVFEVFGLPTPPYISRSRFFDEVNAET